MGCNCWFYNMDGVINPRSFYRDSSTPFHYAQNDKRCVYRAGVKLLTTIN